MNAAEWLEADELLRDGMLQACPWLSELTWRPSAPSPSPQSLSATCYLLEDGLWLPFTGRPGGWHAVRWGPEPFTESERTVLVDVIQHWDSTRDSCIVTAIIDQNGQAQVAVAVEPGERWRVEASRPHRGLASALGLSAMSSDGTRAVATGAVTWRPLDATGQVKFWTPASAGTVTLGDGVR